MLSKKVARNPNQGRESFCFEISVPLDVFARANCVNRIADWFPGAENHLHASLANGEGTD